MKGRRVVPPDPHSTLSLNLPPSHPPPPNALSQVDPLEPPRPKKAAAAAAASDDDDGGDVAAPAVTSSPFATPVAQTAPQATPLPPTPAMGPAIAPLIPYLALHTSTAEAVAAGTARAERVGPRNHPDALRNIFYNNGFGSVSGTT